MPKTGFFVDWDGNTRRVESPGDGLSCRVVQREDYMGVDVIDADGFVCHEATYYTDLNALESAGVRISMA